MEMTAEEIVIVGAGLAGLATSLGLHRLGIRSTVLESSDSLRTTGFALTLWTNAWRALDALGIADSLRPLSPQMRGFQVASADTGLPTSHVSFQSNHKFKAHEGRCVKRKELLEALGKELPEGTIRYSSKVVSIQESGSFKLVHLADGCAIKAKVLIGCDGVNSVVAKSLGLKKPVNVGRSAIRGLAQYSDNHGFEPEMYVYFGGGIRYGFLPCDDSNIYWFCTFTPSVVQFDENGENDPARMKQFVLSKISNMPKEVANIVERTELKSISCAQLKLRLPWNVLTGDILRRNVSVVGDALHPMTPDIGQGGCSALEDSVVLARCLGEAFSKKTGDDSRWMEEGLEKYVTNRRWRSVSLITTAYVVGFIQESNGKVVSFLRENFLSRYTADIFLKMAAYDCGKLDQIFGFNG